MNIIKQIHTAVQEQDDVKTTHLSYHFLREFQIIRAYHRQYNYPLDAWWDMYLVYQDIHFATDDPQLGLLDWQEMECLFEELNCLVFEYEIRAEENLTQFAPNVDEDAHKDAMNRIYVCINDFQEALKSGYQDQLVWPCDQIEASLKDILACYARAGTAEI